MERKPAANVGRERFLSFNNLSIWCCALLNQQNSVFLLEDEAEARQIEEMKAAAKKEVEDWYKHRDEQLEKTKETNR